MGQLSDGCDGMLAVVKAMPDEEVQDLVFGDDDREEGYSEF